jgi:hypothetical protein
MFILRKIEGGRINVFEPQILTVGDEAVTSGQALVVSDGKLVKCGEDAKPTFIALADGAANAEIYVGRVDSDQIYETDAVAGVVVGAKYKLNDKADGITDTAATTAGEDGITDTAATTAGAEIVALNGATVLVRF